MPVIANLVSLRLLMFVFFSPPSGEVCLCRHQRCSGKQHPMRRFATLVSVKVFFSHYWFTPRTLMSQRATQYNHILIMCLLQKSFGLLSYFSYCENERWIWPTHEPSLPKIPTQEWPYGEALVALTLSCV